MMCRVGKNRTRSTLDSKGIGVSALSLEQFKLIHNVFSLAIAGMGIVGVVCLVHRSEIHPRARVAVTLIGLAGLVGAYSYMRLFESWNRAFAVVDGIVRDTGQPFDDTYRYGEWLFTAPLVVVALLLLLVEFRPRPVWSQIVVPVLASTGMVAAAGAGSLMGTAETRLLWVLLSLAPFLVVLYHLYVALAKTVHEQPGAVRRLVLGARFAILVAWSAFQAVSAIPWLEAALLPMINPAEGAGAGLADSTALVAGQLGFVGADLLAVLGAGMIVFVIAVRKSALEGQAVEPHGPVARGLAGSSQRLNADVARYG